MDQQEKNHLKAYGSAYFSLKRGMAFEWLLNYRGVSFLIEYSSSMEKKCAMYGVTCEMILDTQTSQILSNISSPSVNMNLAEDAEMGYVRYIYGELGHGHWSYYSEHDMERRFFRGRHGGPTDLDLYPNYPGYQLILNNVLFPSTKKKSRKCDIGV
jgi:hypothetical protein